MYALEARIAGSLRQTIEHEFLLRNSPNSVVCILVRTASVTSEFPIRLCFWEKESARCLERKKRLLQNARHMKRNTIG
jgi:hypothetical protein